MKKNQQVDLEDYLAKKPQRELSDAFTGELFTPTARNHYEDNDGVPVAPPVEFRRPTVRERVENLTNRGVDLLAHYVGTEGIDMEVPDDGDAPLTASETLYIDAISADLSEQAPLPDEGMPRPPTQPAATPLPETPTPAPAGVSSPPRGPAGTEPGPSNSTVPSR